MRHCKRILSFILIFALSLAICGCASGSSNPTTPENISSLSHQPYNLMQNISSQTVAASGSLEKGNTQSREFAIRLFQTAQTKGENSLISPLSVMIALSMTANGAKGETKQQMESVLGMSTEELNAYLYSYVRGLSSLEDAKIRIANSIWFNHSEAVKYNETFLQKNADYYGAEIFSTKFDNSALNDMNSWVKEHTGGMIPAILDRISDDADMYLLNALAFDAKWAEPYLDIQVQPGIFTTEDGEEIQTQYLNGSQGEYLEDDLAKGFLSYYMGNRYAFVAMLPNEGVSMEEYISSLSGQRVADLMANKKDAVVYTKIPKFEAEYSQELSDVLSAMGMPVAFDFEKADFSDIATDTRGNLYIGKVQHKTFLSLTETGTRAGAATSVEILCGSAYNPVEPIHIDLDRPFLYMLMDCQSNTPFFIGTMMNVS